MTSPWFSGGRNRREADLAPARSALDGAAQALIDLDTRQGYVDSAVKAAGALGGFDDISKAWRPVAERCFEASGKYLQSTSTFPLTNSMGEPNATLDVEAARRAFIAAHRAMAEAATAVDAFYAKHRDRIESSKRAVDAIPQQLAAARKAATEATEQAAQLAAGHPGLLDLRSVGRGMDQLSAAMSALDAATSPALQQQAAAAVHEAAAAFSAAVADAPHLAERVRSSLPSVRTRLQAMNTRIERLPEAQSAMWREFNQASSADLADHHTKAEQALAAARAEYDGAVTALDAGDPETALEQITASRSHAADVDRLVDEVTDRLRRLRSVKDDPRSAEDPVRFAVRDAQRLVVDRGLVGEWGSVLDAQSARIDRAVDALTGVHPDFWALTQELDAVKAFVADVVDRVRQRARRTDGS